MRQRQLRIGAVVWAAVLSLALAACGTGDTTPEDDSGDQAASDTGSDDDATAQAVAWAEENLPGLEADVVRAACEEGELVIYHLVFANELRGLAEGFQSAFPCVADIETFMGSGSVIAERFSTEVAAGQPSADIWQSLSAALADEYADEGMLEAYEVPLDEDLPQEWHHPDRYYYGVALNPMGIVWNNEHTSQEEQEMLRAVETWCDTISPEVIEAFRDRMGIVNVAAGGTTEATYYTMKQECGDDALERLGELEPVVFDSIFPLTDRLAAGEVHYTLPSSTDVAGGPAFDQGANLEWVVPEPAIATAMLNGISAEAPNPNAAKVFMAWATHPDGLELWVNDVLYAPIRADIEDNRPWASEDWYDLPEDWHPVDWDGISRDREQSQEEFREIFGTMN